MTSAVTNSGPFGQYSRGSTGHVLNALCKVGVPLHIVEEVCFSLSKTEAMLKYCGKEFCRYKYFNGIEQPLFLFHDSTYGKQRMIVDPEAGTVRPRFHLGLSVQGTPGLTIDCPEASKELRDLIKWMCSTNCDSDFVRDLAHETIALFEGGDHAGAQIDVRFWKPEGAQAFVDFINQNFVVNTRKVDPS